MYKGELIQAVAEKTGLSKADSKRAVDAMLESISAELAAGNPVSLVGFGNFKVKPRAARTAKNPHTGEDVFVPAAKAISFKAGNTLRDAVNE